MEITRTTIKHCIVNITLVQEMTFAERWKIGKWKFIIGYMFCSVNTQGAVNSSIYSVSLVILLCSIVIVPFISSLLSINNKYRYLCGSLEVMSINEPAPLVSFESFRYTQTQAILGASRIPYHYDATNRWIAYQWNHWLFKDNVILSVYLELLLKVMNTELLWQG